MPSYSEHIHQSNSNLHFLHQTNKGLNYWDWQVTIAFYVAVHLINAHLDKIGNQHYRTHGETQEAINPFNLASPSKFTEDDYSSYMSIKNLSRRSRYLSHEKAKDKKGKAFFTNEKHAAKTIRHLDKTIDFMKNKYGAVIEKVNITNPHLKQEEITNFNINVT